MVRSVRFIRITKPSIHSATERFESQVEEMGRVNKRL